ncbi:arginine--tRNA ligase [Carboxydothermus hydrogenoformans]|uniref:Arginine--tRNA ligase n=1 Tax=Carboxydothermus hydrogenoformans (strain ATCC BAA-161 / DSM 6008 / Z-2901) TaxID=246194 RepID=SYR_CARHZ|nr:arginine--tRNA ligase [Carboxydothermus hydrogenoformans]Q3AFT8.1 RecName: Full=Arginine--tRNA ligase; AltName: Full=Arginyl-tRNA synthetase; Short=ArgRS [Carboxydothermus hydrogenoformans Z-2901]ABB14929.1 arginyl-tRNA synthetase [Carboxydothermus hydrogenoformans Z-2901]
MEYLLQRITGEIAGSLRRAAVKAGYLDAEDELAFELEKPKEKAHGDLATNLAMLLTKKARKNPREIAATLLEYLEIPAVVERVEIAGPGFINFYFKKDWVVAVIPEILSFGEKYGRLAIGAGKRVQVEFVSANPTGLLHMGNGRGAALGDILANILTEAGYEVSREYYINDAGNQIENFNKSVEARYLELLGYKVEFPEEGYHGEDIIDTARNIVARFGDRFIHLPEKERQEALGKIALEEKLQSIKKSLENFGVKYDVWFSERSLHESGEVEKTVKLLLERGYLYEKDGALWFAASKLGEEKDEVLVRKNGVPTYYAADIAYHKNKFDRGFDLVINIWGADHHGHVSRMKTALKALGYDPERLIVILMQLVRLFQGGELVRMSKRTGQYITLDELVEEVGVDAARYFFVMRSHDAHLDFDLDLAKEKSNENPVYYIQYAHARIMSLYRQCNEQGVTLPPVEDVDLAILSSEAELNLLRHLAEFPVEIEKCATALAPHHLARYLHELAGYFHTFYNSCRVLGVEENLSKARLLLVEATRIVLRKGLKMLGVSAPEKM